MSTALFTLLFSAYDQEKLREHILTCMQLKEFLPFPKVNRHVTRSRIYHVVIDIFCTCKQNFFDADTVDSELFMARCSECCEWYHKKCLNIPRRVFLSEIEHKKWKCKQCVTIACK